ncbi:hypothetical protein VTH06DRAFT_6297 [Thermothelomyces fergusii]
MDPGCCWSTVEDYETEFFTTKEVARGFPPSREPPKRGRQPRRKQRHMFGFPNLREGLLYISLLVPAYAMAQSFVGGDLSHQAPYGLPVQDFAGAFSSSSSDATFPIRGYNTSLPAGTAGATERAVDGWTLTIGVAANVPLTNAANTAVDRSLCIDATALSIAPPAGVPHYNSSSWRVCAVVFTDGLRAGGGATPDGTCSDVLPDDCIRQLQADSVAGKAGRAGTCRDLALPDSCVGHFNGQNGGTAFEITPIGNGSRADRRSMFFAAGFNPVQKGNSSALAAAQRHIWPVVLAWTHFGDTGDVQDSAGWLSCAKTTESKEVAGDGESLGAENVLSIPGWLVLIWAMSVVLMAN